MTRETIRPQKLTVNAETSKGRLIGYKGCSYASVRFVARDERHAAKRELRATGDPLPRHYHGRAWYND